MTYPAPIDAGLVFWALPAALLLVVALYLVGIWAVERREQDDDG